MDADHFDALTRQLTTAGSRRRALTGLVSGTLGLFGTWAEKAAAKNCKKIKNKRKRKKCLAKARTTPTCTPTCGGKTCGDNGCGGSCGACGGGRICQGGQCVCPSGLTDCGDVCRNIQTNKAHCGGCGTACAENEICCSGTCADIQTDEAHCGTCDTSCTGNTVCQAGTCFPRSICPANIVLCEQGVFCHRENTTPCECVTSTEGNTFCAVAESFCPSGPPTTCQTSAVCVSGEACVDVSGCCNPELPAGTKTCMSLCPDPQ